jgi:hypothetical protein
MSNKKQIYHPLSMITTMFDLISGTLDSSFEYLAQMKKCEDKPYALDDDIVKRSVNLYGAKQKEEIKAFLNQCSKWREQNPNKKQLDLVNQIEQKAQKLEEIRKEILVILNKIADKTINKIIEMDDLEVGMNFLEGKIKL